ncbi:MAG: BamA/TamA family outer membrane protein [Candidatus Aminicenantes bacterium]
MKKTLKPVLTVLLFFLTFTFSEGQYFGRNKVQYQSFDFHVMKTPHFDVYYYPSMKKAAFMAARMAERWYARLSRALGHELRGRQPLILYSNFPHFQQTTAVPGLIGEGVGGVTEILKRRIVLPLGASLADTDHVIGHELVHAFQYDITALEHSSFARIQSGVHRLPLWLIEGMAEYLSIGAVDPHTSMWMRDAARSDELPSIKKLTHPRYFPYRYGQSLWAYITGRWGDRAVARIIKTAGRTGDYEAAMQRALGISMKELTEAWHDSLRKTYQPLQDKTWIPGEAFPAVIEGTKNMRMNLAPALSPDGKKMVLFSSKDLFSLDLYLVDAETGEFQRKLISTAVDPHFESLQFIKSAGSWDHQGKRFVFGAVSRGQPVLTIIDTVSGKKEKEIRFNDLGEILSPSWSPDGKKIVFSAHVDGFTDLFMYHLGDDRQERLTSDSYGDLNPSWSPDGRSIVFSSERFSSDLSLLEAGPLQLALLEVDSGRIRALSGFPEAKNINPQWAPDSEHIYFISDQNGISNIYRQHIRSGLIRQITDAYAGVSGITSGSPALSVASGSGLAAYSLYHDGYYSIYTLDPFHMNPFSPEKSYVPRPDLLPPRTEPEGEINGLLKNPLFGLPETMDYPVSEYKPELKLDYATQPTVAIGADRFGTYAGGGVALFFSDMLGYRNLSTMFQLNNRLADSAGVVGFQNSRRRLNWGAVAQRIPYLYGGYSFEYGDVYGEPALIQKEYVYRQTNYQLSGFAYYPFNQARRFELSGGYRYVHYDRELWTYATSMVSGIQLMRSKEDLGAPPGMHFGFAGTALVYDSSLFGATSPILGQSYIVQVSPYLGTIRFINVLADYRRYIMPVRPFTLAFRFLHYGRYGSGSEDSRLYPLFLGYETLVRGYNYSSFRGREFADDGAGLDRLFGSKIMVANLELRFPFFQVLGIGEGYYGLFPVDFLLFSDAGVAWMNEGDDRVWFQGGGRKPVFSAGVGLRMNLFGYIVLGVSYVKPFQRPEQAPYLQFTFTPGF